MKREAVNPSDHYSWNLHCHWVGKPVLDYWLTWMTSWVQLTFSIDFAVSCLFNWTEQKEENSSIVNLWWNCDNWIYFLEQWNIQTYLSYRLVETSRTNFWVGLFFKFILNQTLELEDFTHSLLHRFYNTLLLPSELVVSGSLVFAWILQLMVYSMLFICLFASLLTRGESPMSPY